MSSNETPSRVKKLTKKKIKKFMITTSILNLIFTLVLIGFIVSLNVLPIKYIGLIAFILLLFNILYLFLMKRKKKGIRVLGYILSYLYIIISIVGIYYINKTGSFLNGAFGNATNKYKSTYYVMALNDSGYSDIDDLEGKKIVYYDKNPHIEEALEKFNKKVDTTNESYNDLLTIFNLLDNNKADAILIEKSLYNFVGETDSDFDEANYVQVYEFDIEIEEEVEEIKNDGNSFSVYIGGTDFTELYTDFNMIVTVNKKTHKILLTSTPRDFYIELDGKGGAKDLLGYAGVWGINTSRKSLENLYDVNIDYYVKINTQSLVGLVDTLNGVEFCSDVSFTTNHALVMGTYDDTKGEKLKVTKGCKTYSGIEILTIARERKAYPDGDRQRQKNCQQIMISIFNKMVSPEIITNYGNILNAVSDLYTTNIPKELVTELAKDTINNGAGWSFEQQSVTGSDSRGYVHLSNIQDYVMIPNEDSVKAATENMNKIISGK